ncbi:MAG: undecaprenyl-diphosphate phosphatase, partial [Bacteroidota bacterium]
MTLIESIIIAIVEGLTEYLPVSSTGHMIIAEWLLKIQQSEFIKLYTVAIQLGAIMAVIVLYWKRFFKSFDFYYKLFVAFIPAAVIGFLFNDVIDEMLESPMTVAIALVLGGVILLFTDKWFENNAKEEQEITYLQALKIGAFQILALIPGVSRSGATIFGGLQQTLSRQQAAEFSFFLAVPTMAAATGYKLLKYIKANGISSEEIKHLAIGNVVAFIVAVIAIKAFIGLLNRYGF